MGQIEVAEILKKNYPNYMTERQISKATGIGLSSTRKTIRRMRKRNELQYKVIEGETSKSGWKRVYKINEVENGKTK